MGYVGNEPDANYTSFAQQTITGNGGTSYTLSHAVASGKEILLYINNVKQEEGSGKAYEATGTALTLSEAITSSDSCYCVFLGKALQTTVPPDGSVTSAKLATSLDFQNITIKGGSTNAMTVDSSGRITTPARPYIYLEGNSASEVTSGGSGYVNFTFFDVTNNNGITWDSSNGRITVPISGMYLITGHFYVWVDAASQNAVDLYINTTRTRVYSHETNSIRGARNDETITVSEVITLSANDYVQFQADADIFGAALYCSASVTLLG